MISRGLSSINQQKSSEIGLKKTFAELQIVFGIHPPYRHHHFQTLDPAIPFLKIQGSSSLEGRS